MRSQRRKSRNRSSKNPAPLSQNARTLARTFRVDIRYTQLARGLRTQSNGKEDKTCLSIRDATRSVNVRRALITFPVFPTLYISIRPLDRVRYEKFSSKRFEE